MNPSSQEYVSNGELAQPKIACNSIITPTPYDKKNISMAGQVGTYMTPNTRKLYAFGESSTYEL